MRLFAIIMAILIAFPNIGSAFTSGECCSGTAMLGEVLVAENRSEVKTCCSHSPEKDGANECGSKCKCATCFSPILYNSIEETSSRIFENCTQTVADLVKSYTFELPIIIWQPPKQA